MNTNEYFKKYINKDNIQKISYKNFISNFYKDSIYEDDINYLKKNDLYLLDAAKFNDVWIDSSLYTKEANNNMLELYSSKKYSEEQYLLGYIFFKDKKPLFASYSENGLFSFFNTKIIIDDKVYETNTLRFEINRLSKHKYDSSKINDDFYRFTIKDSYNEVVFEIYIKNNKFNIKLTNFQYNEVRDRDNKYNKEKIYNYINKDKECLQALNNLQTTNLLDVYIKIFKYSQSLYTRI